MPAPDTSVKIFHNLQASAPVLSGQPGAIINVLRACLKDGFGSQTVDSIVVVGEIATVNRAAGHTFEKNQVSLIAGATPAGLNGEKKVLSATSTSYTIDATGITDQTATGTITHKYAPLGWTEPHVGTNISHFRASAGTRLYLRIDDSAAGRVARGHGMEWANSLTDYGGRYPAEVQLPGGHYYSRSTSIDATARPWILIGDGQMFYFMNGYSEAASNLLFASMGFGMAYGDLVSFRTGGDAYGSVSHGFITTVGGSETSGATAEDFDNINADASTLGTWVARPYTHFGIAATTFRCAPRLISLPRAARSGAGVQQYPNGPDGIIHLAPVYCVETGVNAVRGQYPGIYVCPQNAGKGGKTFDRFTGLTDSEFTTKDLVRVNSNSGFYAFDIAGPWR